MRVLIVDDERAIRSALRTALGMEGIEVEEAGNLDEARRRLSEGGQDVVLLDLRLPDGDGLSLFDPPGVDAPVVVMSGHGTMDDVVRALRRGARDYLEKPVGPDRVVVTLRNAVELSRLHRENEALQEALGRAEGSRAIIGRSPAIESLRRQMERVAASEGRVLITGENGSGKELVARGLHDGSPRASGPFVSLNCGAVPSELIEAELFGHERGAFTGADRRREGRFEQAHEGTLFLDEVGDMPASMQVKLLRVLQTGQFERVGGRDALRVDVRVLAATNKDLEAEVQAGRFREDLYYRLAVVPLEVPPLRARREDVPLLVEHLVEELAARNHLEPKPFDEEALAVLSRHDFPGNVRELRNLVERILILAPPEAACIEAEHVEAMMPRRRGSGPVWDAQQSLSAQLLEIERALVREALAAHEGHVPSTARALGIERSNFHKKLKALGLKDQG
ncbi:MAG: sigma-54 dependent transcriptional regulator [Myxococcota bacterium]